jgi:hypothetical protein
MATSGLRGLIIRVLDQLRCGEISFFEKDPEAAEVAKSRLEAKRAKRRERYANDKQKINAKRRETYALKNFSNPNDRMDKLSISQKQIQKRQGNP